MIKPQIFCKNENGNIAKPRLPAGRIFSRDFNYKTMYKEFRKTATVMAKLFEKGDEDGMTTPENFDMSEAMENNRYGIKQPDLVPYISTLENQKHRGEFGKHYLCIGINDEKWLVDKDIFERTYENVT